MQKRLARDVEDQGRKAEPESRTWIFFFVALSWVLPSNNNNNNRHTHRSFVIIRIQCEECLRAYVLNLLEVFSAELCITLVYVCILPSVAGSAKAKEEQESFVSCWPQIAINNQ